MSAPEPAEEKSLRSRLFLPTLMLGSFSEISFAVFFSNDLVDVAKTLKVSVGTASQILTLSSIVALIVGIAVGFLAVRFKQKSLLLFGAALGALSILGSFFAPNFGAMLFFSIIGGLGGMSAIMAFAMIGDFLPLQKRGFAIGLIIAAGGGAAQLIMPQVTSLITNAAGWRAVLLWFIFPLSIIAWLFAFFVLPSKPRQDQIANKPQYLKAFKLILTKSPIACLIGNALMWFSAVIPFYGVTFYRLHFHQPLSMAAIFYSGSAAMLLLGSVIGGRLINRVGRKRLAVVAGVFQGIFAVLIVFVPNVWSSFAVYMVSGAFAGVILTAIPALVLEQVPGFRGTMISVATSFRYVGYILGLSISGLLLNIYANNFQIVYTMFGAAAISSSAVLLLFAKDPCIKQVPPSA